MTTWNMIKKEIERVKIAEVPYISMSNEKLKDPKLG